MENVIAIGMKFKLYGFDLVVARTKEVGHDCMECDIHYLCNRDQQPLKELCKQYNVVGCTGLIGNGTHFKKIENNFKQ